MAGKKLSEKKRKKIIQMHELEQSARRVAKKIKISCNTVLKIWHEENLEPYYGPVSDAQKEMIVKLYVKDGIVNPGIIAMQVGVSPETARKYLREAGIEPGYVRLEQIYGHYSKGEPPNAGRPSCRYIYGEYNTLRKLDRLLSDGKWRSLEDIFTNFGQSKKYCSRVEFWLGFLAYKGVYEMQKQRNTKKYRRASKS